MSSDAVKTRGFLMHVSHYDPAWCPYKRMERPFDPDVALELVDAMAKANMNLMVVDCADGVKYRSHPELERHYTVPMRHLKKVATAAHKRGIDVVPKLNFSRSTWNVHDEWMLPHSARWGWYEYERQQQYWRVAQDVIAELVAACRPRRYFHIGMDEDHDRSVWQFAEHAKILRRMVRKHRLRTIIWNDSCHDVKWGGGHVHGEKALAAEPRLPRDVVHILWDYRRARPGDVKRVVGMGFEAWGAPGRTVRAVRAWRRAIVANRGSGLLLTQWIKCDRSNRDELLDLIGTLGPEC